MCQKCKYNKKSRIKKNKYRSLVPFYSYYYYCTVVTTNIKYEKWITLYKKKVKLTNHFSTKKSVKIVE